MSCVVVCLFCRKISKIIWKLKRAVLFRSTRSSSSRASTDMEVDPPSPAVGVSSRSAPVERNVLLQEKQLKLWDGTEKDIYRKLKTRRFVFTPAYDPALLQATCMNTKFELIFKAIGWRMFGKWMSQGLSFWLLNFYAPWNPLIRKYHLNFSKKIFLSHGNSLVNF